MSDRSEVPNFPPRAPESPGVPERTGSHPVSFLPAPFALRPTAPYPQRSDYAAFDPTFPHASFPMGLLPQHPPRANVTLNAPAPIERRAGSEPHTGWRRQNIEVDTRRISIPPALEIAPLTLRDRLPYPDRTMDQITDWMPLPLIQPRRYYSQPITEAERLGANPSDRPNDWADSWPDENEPRWTGWMGHDNSNFVRYGGMDDPNETAAVPNDNVLESIEVEGDQLIALRQVAYDSQVIVRRELDLRIALEDQNRYLIRRNDVVESDNGAFRGRNRYLERSRQEARDEAVLARTERDILQRQRDLAMDWVERYRLERDEPEEEHRRREAQQVAYEEAMDRETGLRNRIGVLEESETILLAELDSVTTRADDLQMEQDRLEYDREQFEMERDHYRSERDREQDRNRNLQAQVQNLIGRLTAAQALAVQPLIVQPPVNAPPIIPPPVIPPPVILPLVDQPPTVPPPGAGPVRGSGRGAARGRGGRGGRGAAAATRKQPGRCCKVEKNYKK